MRIKRILAIISFSALLGLYLIATMPKGIIITSLALFIAFIFIHAFTTKKYTKQLVLSFATVLLAFLYFIFHNNLMTEKISKIDGVDNNILIGEVVSVKDYSGSKCYTINVNSINEVKYSFFNVNLYTGYNLKPGEQVKLTGKYKSFTHKSNFTYNYSRNIYGYYYADKIELLDNTGFSFSKLFANLRNMLINSAKNEYDEISLPIVIAMGIGDKSLIDDNTVKNFSFTGISHALVVSGLHVSFIALIFNLILKPIPVNKKFKNCILSLFIFIFMGIIGFTPSIIRAGCLSIFMLLGRNFIVETDNYTILAVVVLITLIINPYSAASASLLLSYSAYFGVITAAQISEEKGYGKLKSSLLVTTFAVLFASPFLSMFGMVATLVSPIFNLLLSPIILAVCALSFFSSVLGCFPLISLVVKYTFVPINQLLIRFLLLSTEFAHTNFSFALINLSSEYIRVLIFSAVFASIVSWLQFNNKQLRKIFIIFIPLLAVLCYNQYIKDLVVIRAFDSGSETSFVITRDSKNYLLLAENIKEKRLNQLMNYENLNDFQAVLYCPEKYEFPESVDKYAQDIVYVDRSGEYLIADLPVYAVVEKRNMTYILDVGGTTLGINHKKADMQASKMDFYFFGSDTPQGIKADNIYYFYPLLKKHTDLATQLDADVLYDTLTIKINIKTGNYRIVEDVKNFGSQL